MRTVSLFNSSLFSLPLVSLSFLPLFLSFYLLFVFLFSSDFLSYITTRKSRLILAVRSHCLKGNMFADAPYFCGSAFAARAFGSTADLLSTFLRYPPPRYHSLMSVMLTVVPLFNLKR